MTEPARSEFEQAEADAGSESLIGEFLGFLAHNKKWWLLPIVVVMVAMAALLYLSGTGGAPFIYTLF